MKCVSRRELLDQLRSLPCGLNDIYTKIFAQSSRPVDLKRFLQCLAYSRRSMTLKELAEVATIDFGDSSSATPVYDSDRRYENPHDLLSICYGLVVEIEGVMSH